MITTRPIAFAALVLTSLVALTPACGNIATISSASDAATDGASADGASTSDAGLGELATFCTGASPRMKIDGAEITVLSATGKALALNCCDSAELTLSTSSYQTLFYVLWRAQAGSSGTVDLGSAAKSFSIELDLGCDPATAPCNTGSAEERFATGFKGTLTYTQGASGLVTGYCLSVAEQPGSPHTLIHSLSLYAPGVASGF